MTALQTSPHLRRHQVARLGNPTGQPLLMVHGYGCNQAMWRDMVPHFSDEYDIYLFDHVGTAASGMDGWDPDAYSELKRYAADLQQAVEELDLTNLILVGHSVSAIICGLVASEIPSRVSHLVMIGPSPRYINDGDYNGGFEREDIEGLLSAIESNYRGWSEQMAPAIMGRPDAPEYGQELTDRFCEQDPEVGYYFARATFLSDNRDDLERITVPTLVLQCTEDIIAPEQVGRYVADRLPQGHFHQLAARGHCPNLSAPAETSLAIKSWLSASAS